ncbi:MotB family protein [Bradyrhizobium iriomotense]|uniref:Flagellar motor protein MotB n=1 Tax=Bradyrhizobium iriomotense TaxID=441950 RepID=A0ABQ6AUF0_9BRAD|nr:MotB family protein [Bradyrhizobium iriomotense]GLR85181.1 flagellar motor protein MotB [Bradyrhizobium iriomotense]
MSDVKPELVIIRRRSAFDDAPAKGGVWKIAYADFMTAMMAFFLVMWLLNALNQDQRQIVASYFNPIKLAENAPAPKGLKDPVKKDPAASEGQDGKRMPAGPSEERRGDSPTAEKPPFYEEKVLFRDPYATLAEIAAGSSQAAGQRRVGALASAEEEGLKGGEAYRDPFDPGFWKLAPQTAKDGRASETEPTPNPAARANPAAADQGEPARRGKADDAGAAADAQAPSASMSPLLPPAPAPPQTGRDAKTQTNSQANAQASSAAKDAEPRDTAQAQQPTVKQLQAAITDALSDIKAGAGPVAEVRQVEEGLLVSLTDDASFGMFAVGSAEPRPELIRVIDRIGPLLAKRPGTIIVRGHTDNRPYRSDTYDNWRLSTARAQMAYYMLVRSGVDAQRIEHVEGYADRRPKLTNDPAAAQNRRIEILIREKRP